MMICPRCGRTYDDSWRVCLVHDVKLKKADGTDLEDADYGWGEIPGNKFLVVVFSLLLMLLAPVIMILTYLTYFQVMDMETVRHEAREMKKTIAFDEEERKKDKK